MPRRCLLLSAVATLVLAAPAAAAPTLPIDHHGRWMTDATGRVFISHGINMVAKVAPYAPDANGFDADDADFLASEGYNSVRLGVIYKAVEPSPGHYDEAYLDRIEATVDILGDRGISSLLDFHQDMYNERFAGEGFPDWAVQDDGLPNQPNLGFPGNYLGMPALQRAFDHFWNNDPGPDGVGLQDHYARAWAHVAERFGHNPYVLGYDLINEPWPGTTWQTCALPTGCPIFDTTMLGPMQQRVITAIRAVDPTTLAFYEPTPLFNDGADTNLPDFKDAHAGLSFHDYCLAASGGGGGGPQCDTFDDLVFANAQKRSSATGDTLLMTEFGSTDDPSLLDPMVDRADRTMVGWQEWQYCVCADPTSTGGGTAFAIVIDPHKPPAGDNLKTGTLHELSRPYPQVVAGTPVAYGFDRATSTATLEYTTQRVDGSGPFEPGSLTDIAVPRRQYPAGYAVQVEGGRVTSAPGATTLTVASCKGADRVKVTVTPSGTASQSCASAPARLAPRLRVGVTPRVVRRGVRVTLHVTVTARDESGVRPVRGARVRAGAVSATTGAGGRATLRVRFGSAGRKVLTATAKGLRAGRATVTVKR